MSSGAQTPSPALGHRQDYLWELWLLWPSWDHGAGGRPRGRAGVQSWQGDAETAQTYPDIPEVLDLPARASQPWDFKPQETVNFLII